MNGKGTKIQYKGLEYNSDGDRPVDLSRITKAYSEKQLKRALGDKDMIFLTIGDKELFGINKLKYKRKRFLLLEPNPVTFYYSLAFDATQQLEQARALLEKHLELDPHASDKVVPFSFVFKVASVGIIFSFLALEAFSNQMMPDYALIDYDGKLVKKDNIQRWATFDDKINKIIPGLCQKDFSKTHPKKMAIIIKLKKLRDELTHLKEQRKNGFTAYDNVYQDMLDLNLKSIVFTIKQFINFYNPGLIRNYHGKTAIR